jgi:hypothetical protein
MFTALRAIFIRKGFAAAIDAIIQLDNGFLTLLLFFVNFQHRRKAHMR